MDANFRDGLLQLGQVRAIFIIPEGLSYRVNMQQNYT